MTDDGTIPAAGNDPDTLRRAAKHKAAAARSAHVVVEDEAEPEKPKATKVQGRTAAPQGKMKA